MHAHDRDRAFWWKGGAVLTGFIFLFTGPEGIAVAPSH